MVNTDGAAPQFSVAHVPKTSELVAREIRWKIIRGELKEGDTLPLEPALCVTFHVSRPTLREAFRILESEGLISIRRGDRGGPVIHEPSVRVAARNIGLLLQHGGATIEDVDGAFEIILPAAAKRVAHRKSSDDIARLQRLVEEMATAKGDLRSVLAHLTEFNYLLLELTGNKTIAVLGRLLSNIVDLHITVMAEEWRATDAFGETFAHAAVRGCRRLIKYIEAGEGEKAEAFWRQQLEKADRRAAQVPAVEGLLDLLH